MIGANQRNRGTKKRSLIVKRGKNINVVDAATDSCSLGVLILWFCCNILNITQLANVLFQESPELSAAKSGNWSEHFLEHWNISKIGQLVGTLGTNAVEPEARRRAG